MPQSHAWLLDAVADPANGWAIGTFGAIAEFTRDRDEPALFERAADGAAAATDRGAVRIVSRDDLVPVAYETPNRNGETWSHAVALCLPVQAAAMSRRTSLTEIGPDSDAIRSADRDAVLFDLGLGTLPVDVCIRTADPGLVTILKSQVGRSLFEPGNPAMPAILAAGPHRVFLSRIGRAEVYQLIPPADGQSPEGPHTHLLPKLLRSGRTHAATTPIPDGLVPCAHLFPPSPLQDSRGRAKRFDRGDYDRFADLFARFGAPDAVALKQRLVEALATGTDPGEFEQPADKHGRSVVRVALRQARLLGGSNPMLARWRDAFDRGHDIEDDEQPAH